VTVFGIANAGGSTTLDFQYLCRASMLDGLTAGTTYYARTMHETSAGSGTADIAYRSLLITPTS
jgi:hypothetical protein